MPAPPPWRAALERQLVSAWSSRGPLATALAPLALLYGAATGLRRALFRAGWRRSVRFPRPVVVVGNLVAGGAGKTPTVIATVDILRRGGWRPGIVSRGYGGEVRGVLEVTDTTAASACGDEPLLLRRRTGAPTVVGADRVRAVQRLLELHPSVDVVVADDGLQHLALARDLQILVFDERGAGNRWLLPAGPLREPMPPELPPRTLVVYNAPRATTELAGFLARPQLGGLVALADWRAGGAPPAAARAGPNRTRPVVVAAGVGRPERFHAMLRDAGFEIAPLVLADHHRFDPLPWPPGTRDVVVTEKDAVKIEALALGQTRVWVAPLDFRIEPAFEKALLALLPVRAP